MSSGLGSLTRLGDAEQARFETLGSAVADMDIAGTGEGEGVLGRWESLSVNRDERSAMSSVLVSPWSTAGWISKGEWGQTHVQFAALRELSLAFVIHAERLREIPCQFDPVANDLWVFVGEEEVGGEEHGIRERRRRHADLGDLVRMQCGRKRIRVFLTVPVMRSREYVFYLHLYSFPQAVGESLAQYEASGTRTFAGNEVV